MKQIIFTLNIDGTTKMTRTATKNMAFQAKGKTPHTVVPVTGICPHSGCTQSADGRQGKIRKRF